ncbi:MAG: DJ-1/PfpI family protein [Clostridiales Family XIII bacterium]|jgi:4-methyl-5(b-hydroxyethyl)-thiazole monophosphate biosynthesis|nr:DJ-1/PfpI family protein [Clostridiales Family XIII bacterium]
MVYVHFADGFEEIEALTVVDLLRRAGIETEAVSIMGRLLVTGAHGVQIVCDILFEDAVYGSCELIVLPGGMPGAANLGGHAGLVEKILSFRNQGKPIAAICAAPLVLGHAGVLKGKKATCYPGFENELEGAEITEDTVCVDGGVITSRGPATAMPFALALIEALKGKEAAGKIAAGLLFDQ